MGWWGFGVTDGDSAQDIICIIKEQLNIPDRDDEPEETLKASFLEDREALRNCDWVAVHAAAEEGWGGADFEPAGLAYQCMAWLYLEYQLDIPEELKIKAIEATVNMATEEANDFSEPDARRDELNAFVKAVEASKRDGLNVNGLFWSAELLPREMFD